MLLLPLDVQYGVKAAEGVVQPLANVMHQLCRSRLHFYYH
jgi:hypothetical protein